MLDFYTQIDDFLFWNFNVTTTAEFLGACFVMGLLAFGYEVIRILRLILLRRAEERTSRRMSGETTQLYSGHGQQPKRFADWIGHNVLQSTLHVVQAIQNYTLMLAVMTFNAYLLIAVILGAAVGFFVVAPCGQQPPQRINHRISPNGRPGPSVRDYSSTKETPRDCSPAKVDQETRFFEIGQQDARY